jgi:hypothetical protein
MIEPFFNVNFDPRKYVEKKQNELKLGFKLFLASQSSALPHELDVIQEYAEKLLKILKILHPTCNFRSLHEDIVLSLNSNSDSEDDQQIEDIKYKLKLDKNDKKIRFTWVYFLILMSMAVPYADKIQKEADEGRFKS